MGTLVMGIAKALPEKTIHAMTGYAVTTFYLPFFRSVLVCSVCLLLRHAKTSAHYGTGQIKEFMWLRDSLMTYNSLNDTVVL